MKIPPLFRILDTVIAVTILCLVLTFLALFINAILIILDHTWC